MSCATTMTVLGPGFTERREYSLDLQAFEVLSRSRHGQGPWGSGKRGRTVVHQTDPLPLHLSYKGESCWIL
jgi:hypothetical protein